jgi:outer membrane biosynthesis protein TonB
MLLMSHSDIETGTAAIPRDGTRIDRMPGGLIASSVLHLFALALLLFGLPWLMQVPPEIAQIMPINLVQLGEKTASPSSPELAPLPQEKAREVSESDPAEAVPIAQTPPPQAPQHRAEESVAPNPPAVTQPERKPELERPVKGPKPNLRSAAPPKPQPSPADDLSARLKQMAQLRQPLPPLLPNPRQEEGSGPSNRTATSTDAARTRDASYSVKDFIRAQVERRWNLDRSTLKGRDWVVAIHIVLGPDGSVKRAEIVDNQRYLADSAYRDFALGARNAVLLSSPLNLPPGAYDIAKDIVVGFDSKQVLQ